MGEEWISYAPNGYVMFKSKTIKIKKTKMLPPTLTAQQGRRERETSSGGGLDGIAWETKRAKIAGGDSFVSGVEADEVR